MKLFIRSQDKTILTKINEDIYVYDNLDKTSTIKTDKWQLGTYTTKERALEVLDEIQSRLDAFVNSDYLKNVTDVSKQVYIAPFIVYEMPSE